MLSKRTKKQIKTHKLTSFTDVNFAAYSFNNKLHSKPICGTLKGSQQISVNVLTANTPACVCVWENETLTKANLLAFITALECFENVHKLKESENLTVQQLKVFEKVCLDALLDYKEMPKLVDPSMRKALKKVAKNCKKQKQKVYPLMKKQQQKKLREMGGAILIKENPLRPLEKVIDTTLIALWERLIYLELPPEERLKKLEVKLQQSAQINILAQAQGCLMDPKLIMSAFRQAEKDLADLLQLPAPNIMMLIDPHPLASFLEIEIVKVFTFKKSRRMLLAPKEIESLLLRAQEWPSKASVPLPTDPTICETTLALWDTDPDVILHNPNEALKAAEMLHHAP